MEITEQQFIGLEERVEKIEELLVKLNNKLDDIETGLFGNERLRIVGILKNYSDLQEQINRIDKEIERLNHVNTEQDIAIKAKKSLTDSYVIWFQRGFWALASIATLILLLTGKIGIADLWK